MADIARRIRTWVGTAIFLAGCLIAYIAVAGVTFGAIAWTWVRNEPGAH